MPNNIFFSLSLARIMLTEAYSVSESWYWARAIIVMRDVRTVATAVCIGSVWALRRASSEIILMRARSGRTG